MTYSISWGKVAIARLRKLPKEDSSRIVRKINAAKANPFLFVEKLVDDSGFKLRIGKYRAILDIQKHDKSITVRIIGHRRTIYKRPYKP